ncbi:MAG TPA: hypothetical protein PLF40_04100 [Kofleriaceae bacterium]|nr:hypothetical protein [Kofleriaceae bacterium]
MSSYEWWAICDASLDDVCHVLEASDLVRNPRWMTLGDEDSKGVVFAFDDQTIALLQHDGRGRWFPKTAKRIAAGIANKRPPAWLHLERDELNAWSTVSAWRGGEMLWSVYGSADDEYLRVHDNNDTIPAQIADLLSTDHDFEEVPVQIAKLLTGFCIDDDPAPTGLVIAFNTAVSPVPGPAADAIPAICTTAATGTRVGLNLADIGVCFMSVLARTADQLLLMSVDDQLYSVDTTTFPPRFTAIGLAQTAVLTPWQTVLVAFEDENGNSVLQEIDDNRTDQFSLPFSHVASLHVAGNRVLAIPSSWADGTAVPCLVSRRDAAWSVTSLQQSPSADSDDDAMVVSFADDSFLLVWQGGTYRCNNDQLEGLPSLEVAADFDCAIAATNGACLVVTAVGIMQVWPDNKRTLFAWPAVPHHLYHGPGDAIIVVDSDPDFCMKIWWPAEDTIAAIGWDTFGLDEDPEILYYDNRLAQVVVIAHNVHTMPWSRIAALPRTRRP